MYYRGAKIAIIVYDVTNQDSAEEAKDWMDELKRNGSPQVVIGIAANKCDLKDASIVDLDSMNKYAQEKNAILLETSAKNDINIDSLFQQLGIFILSILSYLLNTHYKINRI